MCGIAGFHSSNPTYDGNNIVERMLDKVRYRGPDQTGIGKYGDTTLGMVRLSIIDRETHSIPYQDEQQKVSLIFNGEIYNHDAIRSVLKRKYRFKTSSDAETILYNFLCKGLSAFDELNGMYAVALHDRTENATYVVRDKTGEKPVYYTIGADFIAFASEIKCLLELVPPKINENAICYRAYEFCVGKETLFENIFQLEPGEYLKIKDGSLSLHSYWKVWDQLIEIKDDLSRIKKDLSELIEDAIVLRTKNCAHQYGCFISGGIDSALTACIAKPDYLYTCHYDVGVDFDELPYAQAVAKKIGKELIVVEPAPEDFHRVREKLAYHLDTPCTWTSFSLWMLLGRAQKNIKVIITGDGADELFAGYHRYHLLHHDQQIHNLKAMQGYAFLIDKYYGSPVERYAKLVNRSDNQFDQEVHQYLNDSLKFYFDKFGNDVVHGMGLNDFYTTMQVLLQMSDRTSMAYSLENRSPFLDYRLVQYAFSLPSKYKIKDGVTKWILKEIAEKFIPAEIVKRVDKRGFSAPLNRWFGWDKHGKYDRRIYRKMVFEDWKKTFKVK
ncbi:MAG: asparagine synthase (glutamine-hydrolyzing) [Nitrospinales bacterium]